ncbi:related to peroxisomal membrane protein peroxin 16 [Cephalotrichum gorgonifer]|uniref:Peroxisomal membrane protein PEX16 n=1 Tax=Cephalotrichum gorgonifer TaxID=2041049 RepID=A0AAE8SZT2_9PEZI|nr:related to peroxisomal membrane protein peroxin 16 [Cephalotrichum gorgonifer]
MVAMSKETPARRSGAAGAVLSLPPKWLHMYDDFIAKNAGQVSQIESALRSLTYIIPGRFRDAEIASETVHSSVQLLSLYHDTLLSRAVPTTSPRAPSPHARYTRFWAARSALYRRAALLLQMVRYTELLLEMAAKRRGGERARWRVVVFLEVVKAACRLLLMRITRGRSIVEPVLPEREAPQPPPEEEEEEEEYDAGEEEGELGGLLPGRGEPGGGKKKPHEREWRMPRTGMDLPSLPSAGDITGYLLSRVLSPDDIKPAAKLLNRLRGSGQAAEVLHILAPVVYAAGLAMTPAEKRRRSWAPWAAGLAVEVAARQLRERGLRTTALERDEWRRRGWGMGWWAMRGPFYEGVVRGVVEGVKGRVPGVLGGILEDYEYLWENYYFSTGD